MVMELERKVRDAKKLEIFDELPKLTTNLDLVSFVNVYLLDWISN